ncbi:Nn.00g065140.m01.CDS01 [Neocucurbitaria sp. VM-36]
MPQFADLVRHSVLLARADNNNDNDNRRIIDEDNNNNDDDARNHRRLEIGVIVAIVVAGLAIIGVIAALIMKRRKRQQKRLARQEEEHDITWYGAEDEPRKMNGGNGIGVALGGQEGGVVGGKSKKVAFAHEGEAPPPSYEIVVKDPSSPSK